MTLTAQLVERYCLNPSSQNRQTWHLVFETQEECPSFQPGDSVGVYPQNNPFDVEELLGYFHLSPESPIVDPKTKRIVPACSWFSTFVEINRVSSHLVRLLAQYSLLSSDRESLQKLIEERASLGAYSVIQFLRTFVQGGVAFPEVVAGFLPLLPRLYSISSAPSLSSNRFELTVARVRSLYPSHVKEGVCSTYLIDRLPLHEHGAKIFFQRSTHFFFPSTDLIMVGAGTGIAPFRSFMQECGLQGEMPSQCWLFFGEQRRNSDFFYEEFWKKHVEMKSLHLSLAFSRDQEEKIYVQHRMWEERKKLWSWLQDGASILVCGNAKKMAKDVDVILAEIAVEEGEMTKERALQWIRDLHHQKRYLRDVY